MSWISNYAKSSIGMKHIMGVTGLAMVLFLFIHMAGNLQMFAGRDAVNDYAEGLRSLGPLLWIARLGLIAVALAHVTSALRLIGINNQARTVKYTVFEPKRSSFYARKMSVSGLALLAFIVYHLLHFTFGVVQHENFTMVQELDGVERHDVFAMTVAGFQNIAVSASYIVAMGLLCLHLLHGVPSFFQSLGLNHPKYQSAIQKSGPLVAGLLFVGNISMPIAVLAGIVKLPV